MKARTTDTLDDCANAISCSDRGRRPGDGAGNDDAGLVPGVGKEGWGAAGACDGLFRLREAGDGIQGVRRAGKERGERDDSIVGGGGVAGYIRLKVPASVIKFTCLYLGLCRKDKVQCSLITILHLLIKRLIGGLPGLD